MPQSIIERCEAQGMRLTGQRRVIAQVLERADDHPDPCGELARLLDLHDLLFGRPQQTRPLTGDELKWLRGLLIRQDYATSLPAGPWDPDTEAAAWALYGTENLEERWTPGGKFDPVALAYLRERFGE